MGWDNNVSALAFSCTSTHANAAVFFSCTATHTSWGGVGWDNNVSALAFSCTSTDTSCYAAVFSHALPHIRDGWGGVGIITSMHLRDTSCYAAVFSHALPHIRHGVGWGGIITSVHLRSHARPHMLRCCVFSCTATHTSWGGVGWDNNVSALAFSCTSTDTSCYAAVFSHALPHIRDGVGWGGDNNVNALCVTRHATLLCFLMHCHTYVMGWGGAG